jgi:5-methylthioribose kinase
MTKSFIEEQRELAREKVSAKWQMADVGTMGAIDVMINDLTDQIIQNTGEELLRRAEGERKDYSVNNFVSADAVVSSHNKAINTLKQHITSVTGVK